MRTICGVAAAIAAALVALPAAAVELPTLPQPPVTAPPLPQPLPVLPPLPPAPTMPTPPPALPPAPAPVTPVAPAPVPQPHAGAPAPAPAAAQRAGAPVSVSAPSRAPHARRGTARSDAAAARARLRPRVVRFHASRPGAATVSVRELTPVCRTIGTYRYAVRRGANDVRLPRRLHGHRLGPGTYAIAGRRRAGGRTILFEVITRVERNERGRLEAHRVPAVSCSLPFISIEASLAAAGATPSPTHKTASEPPRPGPAPPSDHKHVASSPFARATLRGTTQPLRALLLTLLAISVALLAVAAAPQSVLPVGSAGAFVARNRLYVAAAGLWLLVVAVAVVVLV